MDETSACNIIKSCYKGYKSRKVLSLPMHPYLESSEQILVAETLLDSIS